MQASALVYRVPDSRRVRHLTGALLRDRLTSADRHCPSRHRNHVHGCRARGRHHAYCALSASDINTVFI
jgi:hypothetical protein